MGSWRPDSVISPGAAAGTLPRPRPSLWQDGPAVERTGLSQAGRSFCTKLSRLGRSGKGQALRAWNPRWRFRGVLEPRALARRRSLLRFPDGERQRVSRQSARRRSTSDQWPRISPGAFWQLPGAPESPVRSRRSPMKTACRTRGTPQPGDRYGEGLTRSDSDAALPGQA